MSYPWQYGGPEAEELPTLPQERFYTVEEDLRLGDWVPTHFSWIGRG